jgi:hypothetical protein
VWWAVVVPVAVTEDRRQRAGSSGSAPLLPLLRLLAVGLAAVTSGCRRRAYSMACASVSREGSDRGLTARRWRAASSPGPFGRRRVGLRVSFSSGSVFPGAMRAAVAARHSAPPRGSAVRTRTDATQRRWKGGESSGFWSGGRAGWVDVTNTRWRKRTSKGPPQGLTGAGLDVSGEREPESLRHLNILTCGRGRINPRAGSTDFSRRTGPRRTAPAPRGSRRRRPT